MALRFSVTPFWNTRQFYYPLERGWVDSETPIDIEHNHSPIKDQKLLTGDLDATTMSMGKYVMVKLISHTDVLPIDPLAVATGLTYRRGNGLFAHDASEIDQPGDLVGESVGIHDRSLAMTYHKAILEEQFGVDPDTIDWIVDDHGGLHDRYLDGELAAVERINDWYWDLEGDPAHRLLYDMGSAWQERFGYHPLVHLIAVDRTLYEESPARIEAFLQSLRRSREFLAANPQQVRGAVSKRSSEDSPPTDAPGWEEVECPLLLEEHHQNNVRTWMELADRYGVFEKPPIPDDRLFPPAKSNVGHNR